MRKSLAESIAAIGILAVFAAAFAWSAICTIATMALPFIVALCALKYLGWI